MARTLCSNEDSSSSDDPPRVNMAGLREVFLGVGINLEIIAGFIVELVVRERHEEATGENPWTTDPLRINPSEDTDVSESRCSLCRAVLRVVAVVLERHESVESWRCLPSPSGS